MVPQLYKMSLDGPAVDDEAGIAYSITAEGEITTIDEEDDVSSSEDEDDDDDDDEEDDGGDVKDGQKPAGNDN